MCRTALSLVEKRPAQGTVPPEENKRERRRLKKIYKVCASQELARRCDQPGLGIDLMEFLKFTELPGLLGEQFFKALDIDEDDRLSLDEFIRGFLLLYRGSREEISQMLFTVLDFTHKSYITLKDMRCVLPYLPAKCPKCGTRVVHAWNMEEKIAQCFADNEILRFENVVDLMEDHHDLFNAILDALLSSLPMVFDEAMRRFRRQCDDDSCKEATLSPRSRYDLKCMKLAGRRYFFDLRNQALYYYNSVDNTSPKGIIMIKDLFVSPLGDAGFELKNIKFSYQFQCNNTQEREEWMQRIREANKYRWFEDEYESKEMLGSGAYGQVMKCVSKETGRIAAVKIVSKESMDAKAETRLRRELGILKFARHPNLLELYDVYETCERIYIVTEFLDGGTLFEFMETKGFKTGEEVAKKIVTDIARGLSFLHENGILHRDLKLENIMLKHEGKQTFRTVLIDYGLSCFLGPEQVTNEPVGTLKYAAPEIISRLTYREKVDSWSLGVILYIMLQGSVPFYGKCDQDVALRILKRHLSFSGEKWENISEDAVHVISGLLTRKPDKRFSLSEVLNSAWILDSSIDCSEDESEGIEVPKSCGLSTPFQTTVCA